MMPPARHGPEVAHRPRAVRRAPSRTAPRCVGIGLTGRGRGANGRRGMGQRLGPGIKRGWTPSPVRAARRIAQMNAARRVREAERISVFWDLVEEQGLTLEELTTRRRRELMSWAKWLQQCLAQKDARARAKTTSVPVPEPAVVVNAPVPASAGPVLARTGRGG